MARIPTVRTATPAALTGTKNHQEAKAMLPQGSDLEPYLIRFAEGTDLDAPVWEAVRFYPDPATAVRNADQVADREGSVVLSVAYTW